jgi:hypothetical protein
MNIRVSAEDAGWSIREAAWGLEERVLWRGSDATRRALERAARSTYPLQRLVQTKLTWPLSDAFRARGAKARAALAVSAATFAVAAGAAGGYTAVHNHPSTRQALPPAIPAVTVPQASGSHVLQGVTPQFQPGHAAVPTQPPPKPSEPPAQVAMEFAQAFVGYEVGRSDKETTAILAATATKSLAKALQADPPRLPANGKVPKARVLNVVLGTGNKLQTTASVSLVRLRAISELRLTLTRADDTWRVAQVLG